MPGSPFMVMTSNTTNSQDNSTVLQQAIWIQKPSSYSANLFPNDNFRQFKR